MNKLEQMMVVNKYSSSNIDNILGSIGSTIEMTYIIIEKNEKRIFTLISYNFCNSSPMLKLEITIFITLYSLRWISIYNGRTYDTNPGASNLGHKIVLHQLLQHQHS